MFTLFRDLFARKPVEPEPAISNEEPPLEVSLDGAPVFALAQHLILHEGYPIPEWEAMQAWVGQLDSIDLQGTRARWVCESHQGCGRVSTCPPASRIHACKPFPVTKESLQKASGPYMHGKQDYPDQGVIGLTAKKWGARTDELTPKTWTNRI